MPDYLSTGQDIIAWFLRRCGQLSPNDATIANAERITDAKIHMNQRYWDVCASKPYRWGRRDPAKQFTSIAKQTVTASNVSSADPAVVTLSATIATSQAGRKFYLDGDGIPHRISTHVAGTNSMTLVTAYTGELTSGSGVIYMDEVTVATDILAFPLIKDLNGGGLLDIVDEPYFDEQCGRNVNDSGRARYANFITASKIRLGPHPTSLRLYECSYNYRPDALTFDGVAGTDTPIIPVQSRKLPGLLALRDLMVDRRDERVKLIQGEIEEAYALMSGTEITFAKPRGHVPPGKRVML